MRDSVIHTLLVPSNVRFWFYKVEERPYEVLN